LKQKKNIVDISFYPEDPFSLDKIAKENNVVAVMDCGVAPGMGNIIFGHHNKTMKHVPNMIEKTLRYPGCVEHLRVLRECGYFSYEPIEINGNKIRPIDLTSKLLFPMWEMKEGDEDYTVMRIKIIGDEGGKKVCYTYNLLDKYQEKTISMARTTGYTCTAVANLIIGKKYDTKGISPPELLGNHFEEINKYLGDRNVIYTAQKQFV